MKTQGKRRQVIGTVLSNKMDKTIIVMSETLVKHRLYQKYIRKRSKFAAHDAENACQIGDKVLITEARPLSKTKRWRLTKIIEKAI